MSFNNAFKHLGYLKDRKGNISSVFPKNIPAKIEHTKEKKEYQYLTAFERDQQKENK